MNIRITDKSKLILSLSLFILGTITLSILSFWRADFLTQHFEVASPSWMILTLIAFLLMFIGYAYVVLNIHNLNRIKPLLTLIAIFSSIIFLASPPMLSRDTLGYAIGARNFITYHQNPFLFPLSGTEQNDWLSKVGDIWWLNYPSPYGPLFVTISLITALPFIKNIFLSIYLYKLLVFTAFFASAWLFAHLNKKSGNSLLFILNPAILIYAVFDGHNDIFMILLLFLALYLVENKKTAAAHLSLISSIFIKYLSLIMLPAFFIEEKKINIKKLLSILLIFTTGLILSKLIYTLDIKTILDNIETAQPASCYYGRCQPFIQLTNTTFQGKAAMVRYGIFTIFYFLVLYKYLFKQENITKFIFWSLVGLLFITVSWLTPWYFLTAISFGLLIPDRKYLVASVVLTGFSLLDLFAFLF